jgi:hypothetical protein
LTETRKINGPGSLSGYSPPAEDRLLDRSRLRGVYTPFAKVEDHLLSQLVVVGHGAD